ncbi:MAG TPA: phosphate ABC transporter ATP-binding protein [Gammaproteobacteria bacterium]|jgi:tungstate transport system ATP-binding protein|nr:phosphate ABC transporter ATP-binding protein [Gammaproteobacteria bacterium]
MSHIVTIANQRKDNFADDAIAKARTPSPVLPLVARDVCYRAGDGEPLIRNISLVLQSGPCTVLLGPNGAGKSLLLRLCHGLIKPNQGAIRWGGQSPARAHRWVAMVFQKPVLLRRSAAANIDYALALKGIPRRSRKLRVEEALTRAALAAIANRPARALSGGEQQRVAIARAWATQPQVLLLDEPTANLDPIATYRIETLIQTIREAGTRIIMSTHDLNQARRLGDEVLFLHQGRLLEHTPAEEFFAHPQSAQAAAFIDGKLVY